MMLRAIVGGSIFPVWVYEFMPFGVAGPRLEEKVAVLYFSYLFFSYLCLVEYFSWKEIFNTGDLS